jgi:hypothetical protein
LDFIVFGSVVIRLVAGRRLPETMSSAGEIHTVLFDLDDTLYPGTLPFSDLMRKNISVFLQTVRFKLLRFRMQLNDGDIVLPS